ncbi:MAG: hypothetical protein ABSG52_02485 [Terriglobales bacterium]|jgi:hypothetical protein
MSAAAREQPGEPVAEGFFAAVHGCFDAEFSERMRKKKLTAKDAEEREGTQKKRRRNALRPFASFAVDGYCFFFF